MAWPCPRWWTSRSGSPSRRTMIEYSKALIRYAFLCPALILLALMALTMPESGLASDTSASLPHLRIVYGDVRTMLDGTVILPLEIRFDNAYGVNRMESLSGVTVGVAALPVRASLVKQTKPFIYRAISVTKTGEQWAILLSAGSPQNFAVRVQARHVTNGRTTYLAAETNCVVFGRTHGAKTESKPETLPPVWFSGLGLGIAPPFHYWPQTEDPVQMTLYLGSRALPGTMLTVLEGSSPVTQLMTDESGRAAYVPPDDPMLNKQGEKAAKQILLVAAYGKGNDRFVVTRTLLLHRNRFTHRHLRPGLALFGGTAFFIGGAVVWARRRRWPV
ncbi:MAG: hypothetical protein AB2L12_12410 [Smithellaceae bacterium]